MALSLKPYQDKFQAIVQDNDSHLGKFLGNLEAKTGIDRIVLATGGGLLFLIYLIFGCGGDFLCHLIGFIYPAYASIKALEYGERTEDSKWLTYWIVYGLFSLVESFTDILFSWIPMYLLVKSVFLVFCMLPVRMNGSLLIYSKVIRPFFLTHEQQINEGFNRASKFGQQVIGDAQKVRTLYSDDLSHLTRKNMQTETVQQL